MTAALLQTTLWCKPTPTLKIIAVVLSVAALTATSRPSQAQTSRIPLQSTRLLHEGDDIRELSLDGDWQAGLNRHYDRALRVPGLAGDPSRPTGGTLWYKRAVVLPVGHWTDATLTLKGARFAPQVYVDGVLVSSAQGGMASTVHLFHLPPGTSQGTITLEIALRSLNDLDPTDASSVPGADRWRSNNSSYLWDSVVLRLHGAVRIQTITPSSNLQNDQVSLQWQLDKAAPPGSTLRFQILAQNGQVLVQTATKPTAPLGTAVLDLHRRIQPWSPEHPHLYRLRTELLQGSSVVDAEEQSYGLRQLSVQGLGFRLNGEPYKIRMGTVVWHRWTRDPEAAQIAFDPVWFERNVVLRLKAMGANALRFHLGLPPEALLDLCDRDGLAVQMEWPFFHGIGASKESMQVQWKSWLDVAMRHPSVVIVHPWNETGEDQVKIARSALDPLLLHYPPIVVAHRDITPIHKYWWSLFENLGLYYDSAAQFGQAVMVDEFGGNYLDGDANPGGYPATRETFLRFLGRDNTPQERLQLQADSNARVAEYWRRLGVAGFSPFCILGSPQDGSNWFLGPLNVPDPLPKPVWPALSAAFAADSLSLEIWNRNFSPSEMVPMPLWFFNDEARPMLMRASVHILDPETRLDAVPPLSFTATVKPHGTTTLPITIPMPSLAGEWTIEARLDSPTSPPAGPVLSSWHIRTFTPAASPALQSIAIGVAEEETELRSMLQRMHLHVVLPSDSSARILLGSKSTWQRIKDDPDALQRFDVGLRHGSSVVLLDAGPQPLGVGYSSGTSLGGPLEGAPTVSTPSVLQKVNIPGGVTVTFLEAAEPESTLQQPVGSKHLWDGLPRQSTWLWNGLRGGLIVPASEMQVSGLSGKALLAAWQDRGADVNRILAGNYYAYELAGYYAFANRRDDPDVSDALRHRVKFLVEDAPSLQGVINPEAPIRTTNLGDLYAKSSQTGDVQAVIPLAEAGKDLTRTPVVQFTFGPGTGSVILSQLLTSGRLLPDHVQQGPGVYGLRYDPVAVQFVLNMLNASLERSQP